MNFWDNHIGGLIPLVTAGREAYASGETDYHIAVVWFRHRLTLQLGTPYPPRSARRASSRETERLARVARQRRPQREPVEFELEPRFQVGSQIDGCWSDIPDYVVSVRDVESTVWRRAVGDERYATEDATGQVDRTQEYDWISWDRGQYTGGHSTTDGLLNYAPLTVLEVADVAAR